MDIPPDHELVIVCHCRPDRRPKGYVPRYDNEGDDLLDIVEDTPDQGVIRRISDDAHFVDFSCPDESLERNKWSDVPDGTIQIVWGKACPVYPALNGGLEVDPRSGIETLKDILDNAYPKLKPGGRVVFPGNQATLSVLDKYNPGPQWRMNLQPHFSFYVVSADSPRLPNTGFVIFTKVPKAGGRRRTRKTRRRLKRAAK